MCGIDEDPFTIWAFEADGWRQELAELLPVTVHLGLAQDDDAVVWPAVQEHGVEIFRRT